MLTVRNLKIDKQLIKIISLSDPKYRATTFLIVLIVLIFVPIQTLENLPNLSICSQVLGEYCYSVGLTRGVSSLLKGNVEMGYSYNVLAPLVLIAIFALIVLDLRKLR